MPDYKLFNAEYRMMDLLWEHEPITSPEFVILCNDKFGWKSTTTYTQIKRMINRGFVRNEKTLLTTLVKREQVEQYDSEEIIESRFGGSLPKFITSFIGSRNLSPDEADELIRIIKQYKEE